MLLNTDDILYHNKLVTHSIDFDTRIPYCFKESVLRVHNFN